MTRAVPLHSVPCRSVHLERVECLAGRGQRFLLATGCFPVYLGTGQTTSPHTLLHPPRGTGATHSCEHLASHAKRHQKIRQHRGHGHLPGDRAFCLAEVGVEEWGDEVRVRVRVRCWRRGHGGHRNDLTLQRSIGPAFHQGET